MLKSFERGQGHYYACFGVDHDFIDLHIIVGIGLLAFKNEPIRVDFEQLFNHPGRYRMIGKHTFKKIPVYQSVSQNPQLPVRRMEAAFQCKKDINIINGSKQRQEVILWLHGF